MRISIFMGSAALAFVTGSALAFVHPFGDPRKARTQPEGELLQSALMPEQAKAALRANCADCHSEATHWPFYARIAPVSWLIERDVTEGRKHMDLSEWQNLPAGRQQALAQEILYEVRRNAMPPIQYRLVHWGAALTPSEQAVLAALATDTPAGSATAEPGDATRGKSVFERKCTGCHAIDPNREGPHLRGAYGRRAGSVPGFDYSDALKKSGMVWNDETLERWLSDTDAAVPNSNMGFSVPKAQDRADVIAFLKSIR